MCVLSTINYFGEIRFWSSWDLSVILKLPSPTESASPVLSLAITSCSRELFAGYSNNKVVTWVKPEGDHDQDNGDYVVVSSYPPSSVMLSERQAVESAASALKYF